MTGVADELLERLTRVYPAARDPERARGQAAYMRDRFPFLGLPAPTQRALNRQVLDGLPKPSEDDLRTVALRCWALAEREYQYFACDWLRSHGRVPGPAFLDTVRVLVTTKSWWPAWRRQ